MEDSKQHGRNYGVINKRNEVNLRRNQLLSDTKQNTNNFKTKKNEFTEKNKKIFFRE